jgi:hypothetical protein
MTRRGGRWCCSEGIQRMIVIPTTLGFGTDPNWVRKLPAATAPEVSGFSPVWPTMRQRRQVVLFGGHDLFELC